MAALTALGPGGIVVAGAKEGNAEPSLGVTEPEPQVGGELWYGSGRRAYAATMGTLNCYARRLHKQCENILSGPPHSDVD